MADIDTEQQLEFYTEVVEPDNRIRSSGVVYCCDASFVYL